VPNAKLSALRRGQGWTLEQVATRVADHVEMATGRRPAIDADHVSKLERGVHTWPNREYRAAFRAVFGVSTEGGLGFYSKKAQRSLLPSAVAHAELHLLGGVAMHRRLLLKLSGTVIAGTLAPLEALDRLAFSARQRGNVDLSSANALGDLLHSYASAYGSVPPAELQPVVLPILDMALEAQDAGGPAAVQARLGQVTSEAASFAGWLAYDLGSSGPARALFTLAGSAARHVDDRTRWAFALASEGISYSPTVDGGAGDARRALALLEQADALLAGQPPHWARAWVNAQAAAKAARLGRDPDFHIRTELALAVQEKTSPEESPTGFYHWFPTRSREPDYLDDYRSGGLTRLRHPDAVDLLTGIVATTSHGHRMAEAQQNLMQLHIQNDDLDAAAAAGLAGVAAARASGLERWVRVVRGVRNLVPLSEPRFVELDEAIAGR
jgi:transcriptional regulator with XRE-family HTH domain